MIGLNFAFAGPAQQASQWSALLLLLLLISGSQLLSARTAGDKSSFPHLFFFSAGFLLLSPIAYTLLVVFSYLFSYLVEWGKQRWTRGPQRVGGFQPALITAPLLAGFIARWLYTVLGAGVHLSAPLPSLVAASGAIITYLIVYQLLRGRGWVWRNEGTGPRRLDAQRMDGLMMVLGYLFVVLWQASVWLILPALSLLVLINRAMRVPGLEQAAQTDAKTGLLNAGYWREQSQRELVRAKYFKHPLSIVMVDMDGLRTINNLYGHLTGDMVLAGIAKILNNPALTYAIVGRFGGEEFALVLPETGTQQAEAVAERLRSAAEAACFSLPTLSTPLRVTASFGVATFPDHGDSLDQLIQQADTALFQAKAKGKNCVVTAADLHLFVAGGQESTSSLYQAAFGLAPHLRVQEQTSR